MEKIKLPFGITPEHFETLLLRTGEQLGYFVKPEDVLKTRIINADKTTPIVRKEYCHTKMLFANNYASFEVIFDKYSGKHILKDDLLFKVYQCNDFWLGSNGDFIKELSWQASPTDTKTVNYFKKVLFDTIKESAKKGIEKRLA